MPVKGPKELQRINVKTMPHPDSPPICSSGDRDALQGKGNGIITEGVWEAVVSIMSTSVKDGSQYLRRREISESKR
jgi:hypothetical protein